MKTGLERRARLTREIIARTEIDEVVIEEFVRSFYRRLQFDPALGPIFAARIADWDAHISKLCAFLSQVALMSGRYYGQSMQAHQDLRVDVAHFDRGLAVFEQTVAELCSPTAAAHFVERPRRIADSLEMGIAAQQEKIQSPDTNHPFVRPSARSNRSTTNRRNLTTQPRSQAHHESNLSETDARTRRDVAEPGPRHRSCI
jgi:hemoglobin